MTKLLSVGQTQIKSSYKRKTKTSIKGSPDDEDTNRTLHHKKIVSYDRPYKFS